MCPACGPGRLVASTKSNRTVFPSGETVARMLCLQVATLNGPIVPVVAPVHAGQETPIPIALPVDAALPLERLVARAYAELYYAPPARSAFWQPRQWLKIFTAFPEAFRRQYRYFALALVITILGCALGGLFCKSQTWTRTN